MSKVSVITPAFNASSSLTDTINSVLEQSFSDWEMIIVDDCSKDNTYKIACEFAEKDSRIKVIKHNKNSGVAVARNTALDTASGDYIAFLDSDDMWDSKKLEKQLIFMETGQYALTYTAYQKFQTNNGLRGKIIKVPKKMTANAIYGNTAIACLTVIVNRKMVGEFHMPLIEHTEDNCTWQSILSKGYIAHGLNENLALYRVGNSSLTKNKTKASKQQWQTYRQYYKFSVIRSAFYFTCYAFNAIKKHVL